MKAKSKVTNWKVFGSVDKSIRCREGEWELLQVISFLIEGVGSQSDPLSAVNLV